MDDFKFSASLDGHESAVKCLDVTCAGIVASGSTDTKIRIWKPDPSDPAQLSTTDSDTYEHDSFVNSLVFYPPNSSGVAPTLLFAGSLKGTIYTYNVDGDKLTLKFKIEKAHKANICALSVDVEADMLLSGSWDHQACLWHITDMADIATPTHTLTGHTQSVWAVVPVPQRKQHYLTGSADKTIKLWHNDECLRTFEESDGYIRALSCASPHSCLSVGNDCNIHEWNIDAGKCVQKIASIVHDARETFLYCMEMTSVIPGMRLLITGNEGGCLDILSLENGEDDDKPPHEITRMQQLDVPASSIWAIKLLPNNDIACAASDGKIWLFTLSSERAATPDRLATYDAHIAAKMASYDQKKTETTSTTINVALEDGQPSMKLIYNHGEDPWAAAERFIQENNLGIGFLQQIAEYITSSVPAARNYTPQTQGKKQMYEGQEYDYVFELQVDDGRELKLPYNKNETAMAAAERFLAKHNLPVHFLPQIAQFIEQQMTSAHVGFADPFTGGSRYVPGQGAGSAVNGGSSDPFTGGGRYVPGSSDAAAVMANANQPKDKTRPRGDNVPLKKYVQFDTIGQKAVSKLRENNALQSDDLKLSDDELGALEKFLADRKTWVVDVHLTAMSKALLWPIEYIAPVFDTLRLLLLSEVALKYFFDEPSGRATQLLERLENVLISSPPLAVRVFVCRCLANALSVHNSPARQPITDKMPDLLALVATGVADANQQLQIAASSCLANFALAILQRSEQDKVHELSVREESVRAMMNALRKVDTYMNVGQDALMLILQAIVTILWGDRCAIETACTLDLVSTVAKVKDATSSDAHKTVARDIQFMTDVIGNAAS